MRRGAPLLEFAVLGLLHESPMHGYQLRKRLNAALGVFRALSYGTLYPCLRRLLGSGLIAECGTSSTATTVSANRRGRIVYELTADGKEHFQALASQGDAAAWEDDSFDVHFAFFARTEADVRLRILEGRRSRLEQRLANIRAASAKNRERMDAWTSELERHGLESTEREVRWLSELIAAERSSPAYGIPRTTDQLSIDPLPSPHRNKE